MAGFRPLPRILKVRCPALEAEILDVGLACRGDAKQVQPKQYSQRGIVAVEAFGGEQEHTELAGI